MVAVDPETDLAVHQNRSFQDLLYPLTYGKLHRTLSVEM